MRRANDVLELIGATPIVRLNRVVEEGAAEVWGKLEAANPGGSVKDRIALAMVEAGADVIDIGAESTRPGSAEVSESEELRRLEPLLDRVVVEHLGHFRDLRRIPARDVLVERRGVFEHGVHAGD